jgi:hypothetical protein
LSGVFVRFSLLNFTDVKSGFFMEIKIAIQGIKGSFHHQVAQEYFGENVLGR